MQDAPDGLASRVIHFPKGEHETQAADVAQSPAVGRRAGRRAADLHDRGPGLPGAAARTGERTRGRCAAHAVGVRTAGSARAGVGAGHAPGHVARERPAGPRAAGLLGAGWADAGESGRVQQPRRGLARRPGFLQRSGRRQRDLGAGSQVVCRSERGQRPDAGRVRHRPHHRPAGPGVRLPGAGRRWHAARDRVCVDRLSLVRSSDRRLRTAGGLGSQPDLAHRPSAGGLVDGRAGPVAAARARGCAAGHLEYAGPTGRGERRRRQRPALWRARGQLCRRRHPGCDRRAARCHPRRDPPRLSLPRRGASRPCSRTSSSMA